MDNVHRLSFVRLIGFSLFWTWLFLVAVSPSPTFGQLLVPWAIPFEIPEVGFRIAFLLVALSLRHLLATRMGSLALAAICVVAGPLTTLTLCLSPLPTFILFASVLAALTDAAMFLMWLCYFGYSKIGQTAFFLSYPMHLARYYVLPLLRLAITRWSHSRLRPPSRRALPSSPQRETTPPRKEKRFSSPRIAHPTYQISECQNRLSSQALP